MRFHTEGDSLRFSSVKSGICSGVIISCLFSFESFAQQLVAPEEILHTGQSYKLAYKKVAPNGSGIYEYTTNAESIENWTTLVTLNYRKGAKADPMNWGRSVQRSLDATRPKPHYKIYTVATNGYARFIFEPDPSNPTYESNVHKSFHIEECDGIVVYQFATKHKKSDDESEAGKLAIVTAISHENGLAAESLEKSSWTPHCNLAK